MSDTLQLFVTLLIGGGIVALLFTLLQQQGKSPLSAAHAASPSSHSIPLPPPTLYPPYLYPPPPAPPPPPSSELSALTSLVKQLIEAQAAQSQSNRSSLSSSTPIPPTPLNTSSSYPSFPSSSPHSLAHHSSLHSSPSSPTPLSLSSSSAAEVPVEVYQEMRQLQESIKALERKNRELKREITLSELSNVVDVEQKYHLTTPGQHQIKLTASQVETIRAIFNLFDTEGTGTISTNEIKALHAKLGEPITDEEAAAAVRELDQDGSGAVTFNKFLFWWSQAHAGAKRGSNYTARFKLIHAKVSSESFNVDKVITQDSGNPFTLEYRMNFYYKQENQSLRQISPWHDIPLYRVGAGQGAGQIFNFVCEIPRFTRAKFECSTTESLNPIKQDTQHGKLRYYKHGDIMFNYGFFPQTWEDPLYVPADTQCPGDNDPLDVLEIGAKQIRTGEIVAIKVLGVLALIDDGETDWKVITISIADAMAHLLNDVDDVETHLPGYIKAIREYFRDYKSTSGKINTYALRAQAMPRNYAVKVIMDCHSHWEKLHLVDKQDVVKKAQESVEAAGKPVNGVSIDVNSGGVVVAPVGSASSTKNIDQISEERKSKLPSDIAVDDEVPLMKSTANSPAQQPRRIH